MDKGIHFFSQKHTIPAGISPELLGIRGRQAGEFAGLGFPILPGFILDTKISSNIKIDSIKKDLNILLEKCGGIVGRTYGDGKNPLLLKIVMSSNLAVTAYPALHNFGLTKTTVDGFAAWVGKDFAVHEILFLIRGMLKLEERIKELEANAGEREEISSRLKILDRILDIRGPSNEARREEAASAIDKTAAEYMDEYARYVPPGFFENAEDQLFLALDEISRMFRLDDQNGNDTALMVAPMVYGNYGKDSCSGDFFSRDIVTGEKKLQGRFFRGRFNEVGASGQDGGDIEKIDPPHLKNLRKIAWTLEDTFKEIRRIRFTVENGKLWLIEQRPVERKSTRAELKLLLDLVDRKVLDKAGMIRAVDPPRLHEILHPLIEPASVKGLKGWKGGIAGAPGAAIGQAYFSTDSLLEARKRALQKGRDTRFILVLASSFAEDVKAIEVSAGVLTAEGGYAAHASVVARQYGKVSLVAPELKIRGKKAVLGDLSFAEGDYLTIDVPFHGRSAVYQGTAALIEPDPRESGLLDLIAAAKGFLKKFQIRANADSPRDAALALSFGADGIGLCRTEHMFLKADRINVFREMLLSRDEKERAKALDKLQVMQREDFYRIFKVMAGKEVTIRLLDSPLHEFMPHTDDELAAYLDYAAGDAKGAGDAGNTGGKKQKTARAEIAARIDGLHEFNPMLGRRGCRIAVSYPEIYAMQIKAVFEAAARLRSEKIEPRLSIMVPVVMNAAELKLIAYGKKIEGASYPGIVDIEEALRRERKTPPLDYSIGVMVELPAAALGAAEIARYAGFFSFGTNDLTQTTLGISRDDFTAFMPDYTRFDLIRGNPFSVLDPSVKNIIELAVERGRLTRPDLVCGLCGEHGANPENLRFCMDAGLDYISCSPYSVPVALLAAAREEISRQGPA
ncbi:MAG: pyruvate, phosphate dikinase [Treponema sp.]|jgi:pyruvate,orthophosphate dikinase|nr:pyruvate, phosphate dikinase [Treponema sp.]